MLLKCCEDFNYFSPDSSLQRLMVRKPMRVYLIYGSGGGGHKASANALMDVLLQRNPDWDIRTINISPAVGAEGGDKLYNLCMEKNWSLIIPLLHKAATFFSPFVQPLIKKRMRDMWSSMPEADVIISLVPFLNPSIIETQPGAIHFTLITDFTHTEGHPWIQDHRQHILCGTEECYEQGLQLGLPVEKVTRTSGMVISPRFYQSLDRAELKEISMQLDFRVNSITSLVFFGGVPPTYATRRLVVALLRKGHNVIVICGNNEGLLQDLCKLKLKYPELCLYLKNFTRDVSTYMQLSDVVVGKPGPGAISEALVSRRPVIMLAEGGKVMDQERSVMQWVEANNLGVSATRAQEAAEVSKERIMDMQRAVDALPENRAVFEVAEIVETAAKNRLREKIRTEKLAHEVEIDLDLRDNNALLT
uniref:Monogalactosyldiacylglycerol synthase n=1 Tax=Rhodosorus marinus TaxID=101924 RepID=A0A7S3A3M6_9RHOD|mmetsp:Transcript_43464/g.170020  ORF Transcript_43464/g.170020 Transcript_43464/m.170020 type:complete len:419 (+) Transcript_43464:125-1381(+)